MGELQDRISHMEFVQWMAFASVEPIGSSRDDLNTALLMYMLASVNRTKKGKKPKLEDYLVDFWGDKKRPEAIARKFRALTENIRSTTAEGASQVDVPARRRAQPNG